MDVWLSEEKIMRNPITVAHFLTTRHGPVEELMSPSADGDVPQHLLPYERELGAHMTRESLTVHVSHMEKRPSIPEHWQQLSQVCFPSSNHKLMVLE